MTGRRRATTDSETTFSHEPQTTPHSLRLALPSARARAPQSRPRLQQVPCVRSWFERTAILRRQRPGERALHDDHDPDCERDRASARDHSNFRDSCSMKRRRRAQGGLFTKTDDLFSIHGMRCGYGSWKCWGVGGIKGPFRIAVGGGSVSRGTKKVWWGYGLAFYRGEGIES